MIKKYLNTFFQFLFPKICVGCNNNLPHQIDFLCFDCLENLPKTNFYTTNDNSVYKNLMIQNNINHAAAFYFFEKQSRIRNIIHRFKYYNQPEIARFMGKMMAKELALNNSLYNQLDYIIPVPLHKKKQMFRGYNQSEEIAIGISEIMIIAIANDVVIRKKNTKTQASLNNKTERKENMSHSFLLIDSKKIANKKVLIVDDVFTTGTTISSLIESIKNVPNIKISVLTLAVAVE